MVNIFYLSFLGARAAQERVNRKLNIGLPLVIATQNIVLDCDKKAFKEGIRPGDTIRQAKITSPVCQVIKTDQKNAMQLKNILDVLLRITPYVEPDENGNGVFCELPPGESFHEIISLLKHMYFMVIAGNSKSKFAAKAASLWIMQRYFENQKILAGKKPWGYIDIGNDYIITAIENGKEKTFLSKMPLSSLWPLPPKIVSTLYSLGMKNLKDLQEISLDELSHQIGDWAYPVKEWASGKDRIRIKQLYPQPCIIKEINIQEPISVLRIDFLEPTLKEISEELIGNGIGFKKMTICISGDFPSLEIEKRSVRPICTFESLKVFTNTLLNKIQSQIRKLLSSNTHKPLDVTISSVLFKFLDIVPVSAKPVLLLQTLKENTIKRRTFFSLEQALFNINKKYGDQCIGWGSDNQGIIFNPEILRREKMLSLWDPIRTHNRVSYIEKGDSKCRK